MSADLARPYLDLAAVKPGDVVRHSPGRTISEVDDMLVALLTVNFAPLHIDAHYSRGTPHGKRIVNGLLIASIAVGLANGDFRPDTSAMLSIDAIDHHAPTFHGDTVYCASEIREIIPDEAGWRLSIRTNVRSQSDQLVMTVDRSMYCPRRTTEGSV